MFLTQSLSAWLICCNKPHPLVLYSNHYQTLCMDWVMTQNHANWISNESIQQITRCIFFAFVAQNTSVGLFPNPEDLQWLDKSLINYGQCSHTALREIFDKLSQTMIHSKFGRSRSFCLGDVKNVFLKNFRIAEKYHCFDTLSWICVSNFKSRLVVWGVWP